MTNEQESIARIKEIAARLKELGVPDNALEPVYKFVKRKEAQNPKPFVRQ